MVEEPDISYLVMYVAHDINYGACIYGTYGTLDGAEEALKGLPSIYHIYKRTMERVK